MSNPIELNRERVSALMDGQLRSQEFAHAVLAACDDADAQGKGRTRGPCSSRWPTGWN